MRNARPIPTLPRNPQAPDDLHTPPVPVDVDATPTLALDPNSTGYVVMVDGLPIGTVYRPIPTERMWAYRNDARGWYGTLRTRTRAVAALVELATRTA